MKIGIIREGKIPADARVPLSPEQVILLSKKEQINIVVQPSDVRAYSDQEYLNAGCHLSEDLSDCDILLGVKEVPISMLIPDKTYFFFSHTIKEQPQNQPLLKACINKNIKLVDYEVITRENGQRVIAFGKFAGMVGAHNALWTYGQRTKKYNLSRMHTMKDYKAAKEEYKGLDLPQVKIVLTGAGRVANGAAEVLDNLGIQKVPALKYLYENFDHPVYTQINSFYYARRKDGRITDSVQDFFNNPAAYVSNFEYFYINSDIMINGIYWDNAAPAFFSKEEMSLDNFRIKVIADITCDIAPESSIPSTSKASTIDNPVFGYNRFSHKETEPYLEETVDMMTIDNLPSELPRDASKAFGDMFILHVAPELFAEKSTMLENATICENGELGKKFQYLKNYLAGQ